MQALKSKVQDVFYHNKPSGRSGHGKIVLITGATGFVGAHLLNSFLSRDYHVKCTVRSKASADKLMKTHGHHADKISFAIIPNIQAPGAFDEAVKGVNGVIHSASPFVMQGMKNKEDLLDPAINGTTEMLTSIEKYNRSVERIVITSSFAAIWNSSKGDWPEHTYTEADWNPETYEVAADPDTPNPIAYCASKTFAERAAFDFVKEHKTTFSVTTICPPMVYGPVAHAIESMDMLNQSSFDIYRLCNGSTPEVPTTAFYAFCDVRDVAEAHVKAYETPAAAGQRYIVTGGSYTYQQVCDVIRKDFPELRSRTPEGEPGTRIPAVYKVDGSKSMKELGMTYRTLQTTIHDMVAGFIELEMKTGRTV